MKRPTYAAARAAVFSDLAKLGWDVRANLKVPHATSLDGETRLWFKPQSVYVSFGRGTWSNSGHTLGAARSMWIDIRDCSAAELIARAESWR